MEHHFLLAEIINKILGPIVVWISKIVGLKIVDEKYPIPDFLCFLLIIVLVSAILHWWSARKYSVENPTGMQHLFETLYEGFGDIIESVIGEEGKKYLPFHFSLGMFIFLSNISGLIPGFESPSSNINFTAGCAIIVFIYYNVIGFKKSGIKYLKHFMGPNIFLAPLMIPIEIVSHLARPFSLAVRLFANIFGEDMVILVFIGLLPFVLPMPLMFLSILTSLIQAFVFVMLSMLYISDALPHEEEAH